ncbi:O-acetyl-ADP-ribose deacetylase [Methylomonas sp. MED-D]|uniref:O-acetyl-ADP-ribose deacetylase n=1 Tax=unclassified Methylomonas TaxID=2608980 RepID=UPI0028A45954|nr:O-acetyl-ADP-ribose deacetylase [Methylomonas sp. MV1]MDT4332521.1 O-acetyl-ADP-ribose deacetylase [Methylomonas sp. MV1]
MRTMQAVQADITTLAVDAVVNAANASLQGGGGVDGAVHRAAGPALLAACRRLDGCQVGQAKLTEGFGLPAKFVIHTVGPVWRGGSHREAELLAACYHNSLTLAGEHALSSIAFPCISTGAYGFPILAAAEVAVAAVNEFFDAVHYDADVIFCCFGAAELAIYRHLLERV